MIVSGLILLFLFGCAGGPDTSPERQNAENRPSDLIVAASRSALGDTRFDCSSFVIATYQAAGIDLSPHLSRYEGNGVARIYAPADDLELLTGSDLQPGDVIFWDNTYDRNEDGLWNDPLTHTGIVVSVEPDGTVYFAHSHYREGVVIASMESAMRMKGQTEPGGLWTAAHLFRDGATLYKIQ